MLFAILDKPLPKADAAPGQSAHHGPDGHLENLRNFAILELADGLEQENRALQGCQFPHRLGHDRVTPIKHWVRIVEQNLEERLVQGHLPGVFDWQIGGKFLVPRPGMFTVAVQRLQMGVLENPGAKIRALDIQVEVAEGVGDGALEYVAHRVRIMEGATTIGFQSALERFQVPHEVLGFGTPFAQKPALHGLE